MISFRLTTRRVASAVILGCGLGVFFSPAARSDEDLSAQSPMQGLVKTEVLKTQADLTREIGEAHVRIRAYASQRSDAIARAKEQGRQDAQGIQLLKEYDRVLTARYVNKKGDFEPGLELSSADFEALNNLARTHLYSLFFTGRTSAGFARRLVKSGIKQLEDIHDAHLDPTEDNNPELEIFAKLIKDDEAKVKRALALLDQLDLKPDPQILAQIESSSGTLADASAKKSKRRPASVKKEQ